MRYRSTRDTSPTPVTVPFRYALERGIAPDGGLYVPETYPRVDDTTLRRWIDVFHEDGYAALATEVIGRFVDDISRDDLAQMCRRAYSIDTFASREVTPVSKVGPMWLLHLSNGPTAAFKDIAMQMLAEFFADMLARSGQTLTILGATSGDTGSSAEYAMRRIDGVSVVMLTPAGRMTPFQRAQMYGLNDPSITNVAIDGVFDDCQDIVKAITADADCVARYRIGAVNSINVARLVAQVVYYVAAWIQVSGDIDRPVSFSVPTGNFGDICAGHIARTLGVPIDRLIVATNENDVLDEFFSTGRYRVRDRAHTLATSSPSMDISKASNFERFIFDVVGADAVRTRELFAQRVAVEGEFNLAGTTEFEAISTRFGFLSGRSTHADRVATIRAVNERYGALIDPHTADAWHVGQTLLDTGAVTTPLVVLETALPVKFADTIVEATGEEPPIPARFRGILDTDQHVVELPADVDAVRALIEQKAANSNIE